MYTINLDHERCKGDLACTKVCPVRIFQPSEKKEPPRIGATDHCVLCGHCVAVCPNGALTHSELDASKFQRIRDRQPVSAEQFVEWVRSATIVTGAESMRRVVELTAEHMRRLGSLLDSAVVRLLARWKEAPRAGRAMLPDLRMRLAEYDQGRDVITYNAPAAIFVHTPRDTPVPEADCDAAMMAILLAAHAHGLGACWNGFLAKAATGVRVKSQLREMLQLPKHHDVYSAATIGYPRLRLHSLPHRETSIRWVD
jgi:ferredoxin